MQRGLRRLVDAELIYQRGVPPQARYVFKHALIQEAAYQALLKSTRQRYHQQIAQVLETRFPDTVKTSPNCWRITTRKPASAPRPWAIGNGPASGPSQGHSVLEGVSHDIRESAVSWRLTG